MTKKILILDDDKKFCQALTRQFISNNYQVFVAHDISGAGKIIAREKPHYAIFDLKLAEGSSLNFIEEAKTLLPELKILILTGYASIMSVVRAIKLGASNYLAKPASFSNILAAIEDEAEAIELGNINNLKVNEMELILSTLEANNYNISQTAEKLNMHRRTLQRKLQKRMLS